MVTMTRVPKRAEVPREHTWAVETIFPSAEAWEAEAQAVRALLPVLTAHAGTLGTSGQALLSCLRTRDEVSRRSSLLLVYAYLRRDEDTAEPTFQALADRAGSLGVEVAAASAFIDPEILALSDETLARFFADTPELDLYRHAIHRLVRQRRHVRSPEIEELLAQTGEIGRAPYEIHSLLTDADLKFPPVREASGAEVELTHGRFMRLMESPDRDFRRAVFDTLYSTYGTIRNTCGATLSAAVKKNVFYARARRYESALAASLEPNAIPLEVYHQLIRTVRANLPVLHRYLDFRRRALGLDRVHMYDLYVPIATGIDENIPWAEALGTIDASLAPLGEEYVQTIRDGIEQRWVDIYENEGKASGAYSWGAYDTQPFILMSYQDNWNSVFTLTHELGHSMHSYYTRRTQPFVYGDYTTFLAEIASTLNEALLAEHLLRTTDDPRLRLLILNHQMEGFRQTLFRQTMFAEFELAIHELVERGEALTADSLSRTYYDLVTAYHGPEVVADAPIALEWARIPHFYMNFYVYQYATGLCASAALTERILHDGEAAVRPYLQMLASGSSDYSIELLRQAGVDMTSPEPIEQAIRQFERRIEEAAALIDRLGPTT